MPTDSEILDAINRRDYGAVKGFISSVKSLTGTRGEVFLRAACQAKSEKIMNYLVSLGVSIKAVMPLLEEGIVDIVGKNEALTNFIEEKDISSVKYMIEKGANPHHNQDKAFMKAAYMGNLPILQYLISLGCDPHQKGDRALVYAVKGDNFPIVQYLISLGANIEVGISAAINRQQEEVLDWLEKVRDAHEERSILDGESSPATPVSPKVKRL